MSEIFKFEIKYFPNLVGISARCFKICAETVNAKLTHRWKPTKIAIVKEIRYGHLLQPGNFITRTSAPTKGSAGARRHYEADVTTVHQVLGSEPQAARWHMRSLGALALLPPLNIIGPMDRMACGYLPVHSPPFSVTKIQSGVKAVKLIFLGRKIKSKNIQNQVIYLSVPIHMRRRDLPASHVCW